MHFAVIIVKMFDDSKNIFASDTWYFWVKNGIYSKQMIRFLIKTASTDWTTTKLYLFFQMFATDLSSEPCRFYFSTVFPLSVQSYALTSPLLYCLCLKPLRRKLVWFRRRLCDRVFLRPFQADSEKVRAALETSVAVARGENKGESIATPQVLEAGVLVELKSTILKDNWIGNFDAAIRPRVYAKTPSIPTDVTELTCENYLAWHLFDLFLFSFKLLWSICVKIKN